MDVKKSMERYQPLFRSLFHTDSKYAFGLPPHPETVSTRIITFLFGNSYKPLFVIVTWWGVDPKYTYEKTKNKINRVLTPINSLSKNGSHFGYFHSKTAVEFNVTLGLMKKTIKK